MINKKILTLSMVAVLGMAVTAQAAVMGSWSNVGNNYKFNVTESTGLNITSLELKFTPAAGSTFGIEFDDTIFDSDGLLAGFADTFILFPASVTSPGATQAKSANVLQAAFTGFTPFTNKNVAQLLLSGTPANPIASNIAGTEGRLGTAVVETIAGDPLSRQEFPILGGLPPGDTVPPVVTPQVINFTLGVTPLSALQNLQLTATDTTLPLGWSDLKSGGPGKNPAFPLAGNPSVTGAGLFSWNPNGWRQGAHTFTFDVADGASPANTAGDALALTVNLIVPEPATVTMLGLALVGFVGCARRRS